MVKASRSRLGASAYRSEVIFEFEELLIEAAACLDKKRGVSLRLYLLLPFDICECGLVPWSLLLY